MATKTTTAMDQTNSPHEEEPPLDRVDTIHQVVNYYFGILEPKQWAFLLTGNPDDRTRFMLGQLLMDMMDLMLITRPTLAKEEMRRVQPWERLSCSLGEALPQTLPHVLVVPDKVFREILDSLRSILFEVAAVGCVKCMLYASSPPKLYGPYRTTVLTMVMEMVNRTIKMLCSEKERLTSKHQRLRMKLVTTTPRPPEKDREDVGSRRAGVNNNDDPESLVERPNPDLSQTPDVTHVTAVDVVVPPDTASVSASALEDKSGHEDMRANEKTFVSSVTEKLVSRALKRSNMTPAADSLHAIHQRLFTRIWDEVESKGPPYEGLHINLDRLKNMDKAIYKDICKTIHCSKTTLWNRMVSGDPQIEDAIVSSFKNQLKRQSQEPGAIKKFFAAIGKIFKNPTPSSTVLVF
ncbi:uncharacterized protein LOC125008327 [Mugil cephalus]|uniref:uncharacterized protein LOC125008327 n=1 Tax=Mugil cephalus TaxID=48193 RepID=UPI001FB830CA|nr:uncharacterized protein LOC125008327 [Mugil cephalus]